uniref:Protein kinase domain-containing protein n=1 Tax=Kalanchoe fedtschenkoi TaxID=63787 RepID=A0A7N0U089_KALFE
MDLGRVLLSSLKMVCKPRWAVFLLIVFLVSCASSEDDEVIKSLAHFMEQLSSGNEQRSSSWGWDTGSDPCTDGWIGVTCDTKNISVRKIVLDGLDLAGTLNFNFLCEAKSLAVLSLEGNQIVGDITETISSCKYLTHVYLSGNRLAGKLPDSLSQLRNLKRLDISNNGFSGELPDLTTISGLLSFLAQNNRLNGSVPALLFSNLVEFNVSNNNFSGPVPDVGMLFGQDSFLGNPGLCGNPLPNACPPKKTSKGTPTQTPTKQYVIYSGYSVIGLAVVLLVAYKCFHKRKASDQNSTEKPGSSKGSSREDKPSSASSVSKGSKNRSEYSITSAESGMAAAASSTLVVLKSPVAKGLKFEELLRAPAEPLGRGKHGSMYKVMVSPGATLAVKRIKDWAISSENFRKRMETLDKANHPNVLPLVAFYCSKQEKLLVYEYQRHGSLFNHLLGSQNGERQFDWASRLHAAASIAGALAYMHERFTEDPIAHGNLKSTNIILNKDMEPCISEYGLMVSEQQQAGGPRSMSKSFKFDSPGNSGQHCRFKVDVYNLGVILLELLTGKAVGNNGVELARWVHSVVREEWTCEVFDRGLVSEGASEERMVILLQVAVKCTDPDPHARPGMSEVAGRLRSLKEEHDNSSSSVEASSEVI